MSSQPTSPTLLDRLKDTADAAAWARFESVYGDLIVAFCRRRGVQATDADDVRQDVTLKLMKSLKNFTYNPECGRFRDYLFRVTRSVLSDRMGSARERAGPLDTAAEEQAAAGVGGVGGAAPHRIADEVEAAWHDEWEAFHFRRAWGQVQGTFATQHLEVFKRLLSGDAVRQVAEAFTLSEDAVHKIKQRVRDRLKEQIAVQVAEEDGG